MSAIQDFIEYSIRFFENQNTTQSSVFEEFGYIFYPFVFVIGASLGSFYFNLSHRISIYFYTSQRKTFKGWARWREILLTPSHCEDCGESISSKNLIPILGYFLSRGECKNCAYPIPLIYPIGEFLFGLFGVAFFAISTNFLLTILLLLLSGHLLISMFTDYRYFSLDYENLIWIFLWGFTVNLILEGRFPLMEDYLVLIGFFGFFLVIYLFYPKGLGFGDVLFAPVFAFLSGHPWWLFFLNASYIPAVIVTILMRNKGQSIREIPIPMGVYFCSGLFLTYLSKLIFNEYGVEIKINE